MRHHSILLSLFVVALGCGGGGTEGTGAGSASAATGGEATGGEATGGEATGGGGEATGGEATRGGAEASATAGTGLGGLSVGETLTFEVHNADIEDSHVRLDISEVVRKGAGVAVKLTPIGVPLDGSPIYVGWVIANEAGLFALEPHVSLTEPGFVPIDEAGQLVTEATASIAWHVPSAWLAAAADAFENSTQAGWSRGGYQEHVGGAIHGESCAELRRADSDLTMSMTVCRNLGMIELVHRGGADDTVQSWRLVDVGETHRDPVP